MPDADRPKRPELPRTAPIRHWPNGAEAAPRAPAANGAEAVPRERVAADPPASAPQADAVGRGVNTGYRVIEEYVRRGQEVARGFPSTPAPSGGMSPQQLTSRMVKYGSDLISAWLQFVELAMQNGSSKPEPPSEHPEPFTDLLDEPASPRDAPAPPASSAAPSNGHAPAAAGAPRAAEPRNVSVPTSDLRPSSYPLSSRESRPVIIELEASRPATVRLDLRSWAGRLVAHDLRAADPAKPRITGVRFEEASDRSHTVLHIALPGNQPAGIYNGMVIDEASSLPAGTISVEIRPDQA